MIYSKGNLHAANITKNDKDISVLNNVHFTKEGGSIASGGEPACVLAVSPVTEETKENVPLIDSELKDDLTINSESVKEVIKNIPKDTKYGGALEHTDLERDNENINFIVSSGKGRIKRFEAKEFPFEYVDYKEVYKNVFERKILAKTAINLKRFITMLETIDKICPDSAKHSIVHMSLTDKNDVILHCENVKNGQRVLGIIKAYEGRESEGLKFTEWERGLTCQKRKKFLRKRKKLRKKLRKKC